MKLSYIFIFFFSILLVSATSFGYNILDNEIVTGTGGDNYYNVTNITNYINQTTNVTINETQFSSDNPISIDISWLTSFINSFGFLESFTEQDTLSLHLNQDNWFNDTNGWINWIGNSNRFNETKLETIFYQASAINNVTGTMEGSISDIQTYNGTSYNISEVASDLELRINFTGVVDFNELIIRYKSSEEDEPHLISVQIYDYENSEWESYGSLTSNSIYQIVDFGVYDADSHISGGVVQIRIFQDEGVPPKTHKHQFDWVTISKGFGTPNGEEIDPRSFHINENLDNTGYNITASYLFGVVQEIDPLWTGNFTLYNSSWSSTYNATYSGYNSTGLIKDWNATGWLKNWAVDIGLANTTLYNWITAQNYITNSTMNKTVSCSNIIGSPDSDFCTDATGGASGGGINITTTTCAANNFVSALNNATGAVTCSAGGSSTTIPLASGDFTTVRQYADLSTNNNWTWSDSDLKFNVSTGQQYQMKCEVFYTGAAATTGQVINMTTGGSVSNVDLVYQTWSAAATPVTLSATVFNTNLIGTGGQLTPAMNINYIFADFTTTGEGVIKLQFRSEVNLSDTRLIRGSSCTLKNATAYFITPIANATGRYPATIRQSVDVNTTNATVFNSTQLNFTLESGKIYKLNCEILYTSAATSTGQVINVSTTASVSNVNLVYQTWSAAATPVTLSATVFGTALTGTGSGAAITQRNLIVADFNTTSTGILSLLSRSEIAGSQLSIKGGSVCELWDMT
jgi:hypothetical protein